VKVNKLSKTFKYDRRLYEQSLTYSYKLWAKRSKSFIVIRDVHYHILTLNSYNKYDFSRIIEFLYYWRIHKNKDAVQLYCSLFVTQIPRRTQNPNNTKTHDKTVSKLEINIISSYL